MAFPQHNPLKKKKKKKKKFHLYILCNPVIYGAFFHRVFPQMCFEEKWLQNRLRADKNELRSLSVVDIQGHRRGGFCIIPIFRVVIE